MGTGGMTGVLARVGVMGSEIGVVAGKNLSKIFEAVLNGVNVTSF